MNSINPEHTTRKIKPQMNADKNTHHPEIKCRRVIYHALFCLGFDKSNPYGLGDSPSRPYNCTNKFVPTIFFTRHYFFASFAPFAGSA